MSTPCATDTHVTACSDEIDGPISIPIGFEVVETFIDGQTVWQTNPPPPPGQTINFLVQQNGGKILIDDDDFLVI